MLWTLWAPDAWPAAFQLDARTEAQVYELPAYRGTDAQNPVLLPRRRIVQYLTLDGFELVRGEDFGFETSLRVFADLGLPPGEATLLDGVRSTGMDLLYASVRYRKGGTEVQLGRQMYVDLMDYLSFDGLRVRYVSPWGLGAEAYGGLWVKGSSLFSSSVYQPDGTRETDARRLALLAPATDPSLGSAEPLWGAKVLLENLGGVFASVGYRKSWLDGYSDFERAAVEVKYGRGLGLSAGGGAEYDILSRQASQFRAQVRYDGSAWAVTAEALRVAPVLSSQSIWYYFANGSRDEVHLRGDYTPMGPVRYYLQLVGAQYETVINGTDMAIASILPSVPAALNAGGSAGAALHLTRFRAAADVTYRDGYGGRQLWVDLTGGTFADKDRYTLDGRLSLAAIQDAQNPLLAGTFGGLQVWGGYRLTPATRVSLVFEENVNAFAHFDTKVFFVFDLRAQG